MKNNKYKSEADSPKEIEISTYWKHGGVSTLREALSADHKENLYNWFTRTYPDLNPSFYGIFKKKIFKGLLKKI